MAWGRSRPVEGLRAYRLIAGMWIRSTLTYRASFALTVCGNLLLSGLDFVAILLMFAQVDALGGGRCRMWRCCTGCP